MKKTTIVGLAFALLGLLGMVKQANASIVVFTNRTAFEGALGTPIQTETFNDAILLTGLSFNSNTGSASISSGSFNDRLTPGTNTTFSFVPNIFGFGGNFDLSPGGAGLGIQLTTVLAAGGTGMVVPEIPNSFTGGFFGFISTDGLTGVRLTSGTQGGVAESFSLDNLTFGGAAATATTAIPEPGSLALVGMALAALVTLCRRKNGTAWSRTKQSASLMKTA